MNNENDTKPSLDLNTAGYIYDAIGLVIVGAAIICILTVAILL